MMRMMMMKLPRLMMLLMMLLLVLQSRGWMLSIVSGAVESRLLAELVR